MPPSSTKLSVDRPMPQVVRVLINRPEKRNAIDAEVREQLIAVFEGLSADVTVRAVVLGGAGGNFSAGGDLPSMLGLSASQARSRMQHIASLCRAVHGCALPVIAALEGICAGACVGLALLTDHLVAGERAQISFPFMKLGLVPDWGLLRTLPLRVGMRAARRLLLSGETLGGVAAHSLGLADDVAGDGEVMAVALRRAEAYAALPRDAFARLKQRLNTPSASLSQELLREEEDQTCLLLGADFREGYAAFTDKRRADFTRPADEA